MHFHSKYMNQTSICESKLPAGHNCVIAVKSIVTNSPPFVIDTNFNEPFIAIETIHNPYTSVSANISSVVDYKWRTWGKELCICNFQSTCSTDMLTPHIYTFMT